MIAEVVFNLPVDRAFDYLVPESWGTALQAGMRVMAPFGSRRLVGMVIRLRSRSRITRLKALLRRLDASPVLAPDGFRLAQWLADSYCCSRGQACACMIPTGLRLRHSAMESESADSASLHPAPTLTSQQRDAFSPIASALQGGRPQTFLLHGVTGSGKTELYLQAIALARRQGRSAIVLVPEIAITPQMIDRFQERFGSDVVLWHSRLTSRQRAARWQRIAQQRSRIVVGTRSAVFAPLENLGVIVLDEEHDPSYKQDHSPRYHARDVAIARAKLTNAVVILGSATPSVDSYYAAQQGRFRLLELTERVEGRALPRVEIIDMREELANRGRLAPLSARLAMALRRVVDLKEQAILLLNRRGFARVAQCHGCGNAIRCSQCAVPLVYHASTQQLVCHYCNARQPVPEICPSCRRGYLRLRGSGTERIESELHRLFPVSGIGRMDTDTTKGRESHRRLYESIKTQQIDLLVGTQMVAKGFDIPQVTLVGVVSADTALNLPDFRSGERTFDLLTQVAGRAGRGDRAGQVLIQTYCPQHYAIQAASRHDYQAFYQAEIRLRRELKLPPVMRLVELTMYGSRQDHVRDAAHALALVLGSKRRRQRIAVLGPAPHRVARVRRTFRWCIVLKARSTAPILSLLRRTLGEGGRFRGLPVLVDVDP